MYIIYITSYFIYYIAKPTLKHKLIQHIYYLNTKNMI